MPRLTIAEVLADPCTSFWLKQAIEVLLLRDPLDAAADAEVLSQLMNDRMKSILGERGW